MRGPIGPGAWADIPEPRIHPKARPCNVCHRRPRLPGLTLCLPCDRAMWKRMAWFLLAGVAALAGIWCLGYLGVIP